MRYNTLIFILLLTGCSCASLQHGHPEYRVNTDTLTNIPAFNIYSVYEQDKRIHLCIKPIGHDSLLLYTTDITGKWQEEGCLRIPDEYARKEDMDKVSEWCFVSKDTVIAVENYRQAVFLDIRHNSIIRTLLFNSDSCDLDTRCFAHVQWNAQRQVLPLMYISYNTTGRKFESDVEIVADYSLEKGLVPVPVRYPQELTFDYLKSYLFCFQPFVVSHDNITTFAFSTSPMMILYDHQNGKLTKKMVKNPHYKALPPIDTTEIATLTLPNFIMRQYLIRSFNEYLLYDPCHKVYYRFFSKEMPLKNEEGLFNTLDDKEYGVTLLDSRLHVLGDACFRPDDFSRDYRATSKGLFRAFRHNDTTIIKNLIFYED